MNSKNLKNISFKNKDLENEFFKIPNLSLQISTLNYKILRSGIYTTNTALGWRNYSFKIKDFNLYLSLNLKVILCYKLKKNLTSNIKLLHLTFFTKALKVKFSIFFVQSLIQALCNSKIKPTNATLNTNSSFRDPFQHFAIKKFYL